MKRLFPVFLLTSLLIGCLPAAQSSIPTTSEHVPTQTVESPLETGSAQWWKDAVFYEIFVRSFNDSDGDGVGDFNGVIQKLDYLQELGINAIWLMPIHPSPSYHGYDVLNFYAVNPEYGSMDDFKNLLNEAHRRDIKIIIDLILNHTSSRHPFFDVARRESHSEYRDWYVWSDTGGNRWYEGNAGYYSEGNAGYYYAYFGSGLPDLNYRNPDVTEQMNEVTRYWLTDIGVDGFRIDAAKHLIEEGDKLENTDATHEWFKGFYTFYKSQNPDAYTVGEVGGAGGFMATKYKQQTDQIFNFELASAMLSSVSGESNTSINGAWRFTLKDIPDGDYATFLTNHDQNRVMNVLQGNREKAKLAAVILLTSPGIPFIYYGEEIGMQGKKPDENIRLPMQWSADANAGFTTGTPWRAPDPGYADVNVAEQDQDPNSLLNLYRTLIQLRKDHAVLRTGQLTVLDTDNSGVYAILRSDESSSMIVLVNLKGTAISDYSLSLKEHILTDATLTPISLLDTTSAAPLTIISGSFTEYKPVPELPAYQVYIFQLK